MADILNKLVKVSEDLLIDLRLEGASVATISIMEEAVPNIIGIAARYDESSDTYAVVTQYRGYQCKRNTYTYHIESRYLVEIK